MSDLAGLGRIPSRDPRRASYPMATVEPRREYRNWLLHGPVGDQGSTSQCVAYAFEHLLRFLPIVNARKSGFEVDRARLYREAQQVDYWPGSDYSGTSVDAGAKILRSWGYLSGWTWAYDADTVAAHILEVGPVIVGTTWTMGMFTPDRDGFIHPDGGDAGGHAYVLKGYHAGQRCFYLCNSWGSGWSGNGMAKISHDDMDALIRDNGEACAPAELDVEG